MYISTYPYLIMSSPMAQKMYQNVFSQLQQYYYGFQVHYQHWAKLLGDKKQISGCDNQMK